MSHTCKALTIHCIDFRLQKSLKDFFVQKKLLGATDIVAAAGSIQELAQSEHPETTDLFKQIRLSSKLHGIQEVHLINHTDCGAYGGHAAFKDADAEMAAHTNDMERAEKVIQHHFPSLSVHHWIAKVEDEGGDTHVDIVPVSVPS